MKKCHWCGKEIILLKNGHLCHVIRHKKWKNKKIYIYNIKCTEEPVNGVWHDAKEISGEKVMEVSIQGKEKEGMSACGISLEEEFRKKEIKK